MHDDCTVYRTMDFVAKKWSLLILLELYKGEQGKKRYSEIKNSLPDITPKMLSARLKELEMQGLITKRIDATGFPVKCEYSLTKSGSDFISIIKDIKQWALKWKIHNRLCEQMECKKCEL